ncbi:MAG: division/cell wall cluster transcriptional repressor MraZ [Candidatus Anammoximicrobium sp.]|nr:division/cell wall cluster transcriptional repressor MraZ [Candidatus Anammoximicrobium sp.]
MLLTGKFRRSLDDKLRFAIPRPLREAMGAADSSVLYLAPGTDGSLELYSEAAFANVTGQLACGSRTNRDIRAFHRLFYGQVQMVELDKQGRVRLPADLAQLASIGKDIVLLGVGDHVEIWDVQRWEAYLGGTQPYYDELAERAFPDASRVSDLPRSALTEAKAESPQAESRPNLPR